MGFTSQRANNSQIDCSKIMPSKQQQDEEIFPTEWEYLTKLRIEIDARGWKSQSRGDDRTLIRFLRARDLDVNKAALMYGDYVQWRQQANVDSILQTFTYPELHRVLEAWPQNWHKTDKLGRPVNIQLLSRLKLSDVFQATTEDRLLMRAMWVWEELHERRLPACSSAAGSYIGQATVIFDLHNVSVSTFTNAHVRRILSKMANLFSRYYPDYLGRLIIINVPVAFWVVWEMLRPFINDRTQKKIRIHRGNGLEDLLNTIHAEDLPSFLGGRCRCPGGCEHALTGP